MPWHCPSGRHRINSNKRRIYNKQQNKSDHDQLCSNKGHFDRHFCQTTFAYKRLSRQTPHPSPQPIKPNMSFGLSKQRIIICSACFTTTGTGFVVPVFLTFDTRNLKYKIHFVSTWVGLRSMNDDKCS